MSSKLKSSYAILEEKVKERTAELEKLKTGLEETVADRTKTLEEKTKTLEEKMTELEKMNKIMTDRELTMVKLKKKIEEMSSESNKEEADNKDENNQT
jgi:nitrate/nitrite-specific signal transduction histidine kinase